MPEPTSNHPQVSEWLSHIRALAVDIGPRGSTREGERKGAEYAQAQFEKFGLKPVWESFKSARSIFQPHLVGSLLMLLAFVIFPLGGRTTAVLAALLSILVLVSELQELGFQNNFYRLILPKGDSQNVHAVVQPAGEHHQDLVLVGHLDSQRTPLIFRTPGWVKAYDRFTTVALYHLYLCKSFCIRWPFSSHGAGSGTPPFRPPSVRCSWPPCASRRIPPPSPPVRMTMPPPAGLVLAPADHFIKHPLQHTRVLAVCSGCEEVQHYGMIDWYKRHRAELKSTRLVFEMLGCAGPAWLTREGIIVPFKADPNLLAMVEKLAGEHPEWKAYRKDQRRQHRDGGCHPRQGARHHHLWHDP